LREGRKGKEEEEEGYECEEDEVGWTGQVVSAVLSAGAQKNKSRKCKTIAARQLTALHKLPNDAAASPLRTLERRLNLCPRHAKGAPGQANALALLV